MKNLRKVIECIKTSKLIIDQYNKDSYSAIDNDGNKWTISRSLDISGRVPTQTFSVFINDQKVYGHSSEYLSIDEVKELNTQFYKLLMIEDDLVREIKRKADYIFDSFICKP